MSNSFIERSDLKIQAFVRKEKEHPNKRRNNYPSVIDQGDSF